ncbi:benzoate 4-monooxygenase cytochrome P450 [Tricladium varicosporioides]|nr:benzoate 4-monooxygenase cytochrome P450 [Hymenoscyphus varicosporioides]
MMLSPELEAVLPLTRVYGAAITINHPLSKFPGPWHASFSNFSYCRRFMKGRQPYEMLKLHEKFGPIVRTAPNELSFSSASSWRDIYGPRKGHQTFIKSEFYDGGSFAAEAHSIVSERDPSAHGEMRKYLSSAFSDRSLKEQEYLVAGVIDEFIEEIGKAGRTGLDLVMWLNLATFDIIGNLAFGKSFEGIRSGKEHFWVAIVVKSLRMGALADCFKRFPWIGMIFQKVFSGMLKKLIEDTRTHEAYTMKLVQERINRKTDRQDFMTRILESREKDGLTDIQIAAHASDFVIAGSETTATALACVTYYLQRNPDALQKLRQEIRTSFSAYEEVTANSTVSLKYLNAVLLEGMRMYPPLPFALPRVVPQGGDTVDGHFLPGGTVVSTNPFAASMCTANFKNPWAFKPERWLGSNQEDVLEASQPFSYGGRSCLGRSLGWMELRTILAKLHFKYDLQLMDEKLDWQEASEMHTLWQKPKLMVKVMPRDS